MIPEFIKRTEKFIIVLVTMYGLERLTAGWLHVDGFLWSTVAGASATKLND